MGFSYDPQCPSRRYPGIVSEGAPAEWGFRNSNWEDLLLTVEVHDPIYDQDGIGFLSIDSLTLTTLPSVCGLSICGAALLVGGLIIAAGRHLSRVGM
jgi:hypothetical protein